MTGSQAPRRLRSIRCASIIFVTAVLVLGGSFERRVAGQVGAGPIELVSATTTGIPGGGQLFVDNINYDRGGPSHISADNRYVVFASPSNQLAAGDTNAFQDIFVRDRQTGTTTLVSRAAGGGATNDHSGSPVISANGRFVAYVSLAANIVPGDANGFPDVFVRDLQTGATSLVSVSTGGAIANSFSSDPAISADGRYIAFTSFADNLIVGDTNRFNSDVFLRDTVAGTTERVSVRPDGSEIVRADSSYPSISADGRRVAFSVGDNALGGPPPASAGPNFHEGIYVRDLTTSSTILASARPDGTPASLLVALHPMISANGRYVTFTHWEDLDPNFPDEQDENDGPYADIFVRDLQTSVTDRVSLPFPGGPAEESGFISTISANGRYVAYLANDNGCRVRDRVAGTTIKIEPPSVAPDGLCDSPSISEDGQLVYFESYATNLVANDTNNLLDTFVFRMAPSADLSLTLTASTLQPAVNSNVTLTVGVTNGGFAETTGVGVRALLPAGLTFISATTSAGSYSNATGLWTVGTLASGATSTLQIVARFTAASSVAVTAEVSASSLPDPDSTPDNAVATEDDQRTIALTPGIADLSLALTANTTTPTVSSNVTLTASLTNSGPGSGSGVAARVVLPASLTFVSATASIGTYDSATGTWTLPSIANGLTRTLQVVARVTSTAEVDIVGQVSAANETDPDSTPNNNVAGEDDQASVHLAPAASTGIIVNDATPAVSPTDGKCTLIEAIIAANTDAPSGNALGECAGGSGADTIHLRALTPPYTLVAAHNTLNGANGLPAITSDITIDGGGATIERSLLITVPVFRLFFVAPGGRLALDHVVLRNGRAFTAGDGSYGGAILNYGSLLLDASVARDNAANCDGGGIESAGPLTLRNGTSILNNSSNCSGGGVGTFYAGSVTVENTTLQGNSAVSGGGLFMHGTTTATMSASQVVGNLSVVDGGGIFLHGPDANLSIADTAITGNTVTNGSGGGIANGKVDSAGIPAILGGRLLLNNVSVTNNRVTSLYGGGLSSTSPARVVASRITDNQLISGRCGGGLYNAGEMAIASSSVLRNAANFATGGGICSIGLGALTVSDTTVHLNSATIGGGVAIYFSPSATFTNTTITSNTGFQGGGLYANFSQLSSALVLDNSVIEQNAATDSAGGIWVSGGTTTLRNNTRVLNNVATLRGGGIAIAYSGTVASFTMTGGTIDGNSSNGAVASFGGGGGLVNADINLSSTATLTGVTITNNRALLGGNGGGLFNRGRLVVTGGIFSGNTGLSGGAISNGTSLDAGGPLTLTDVTLDNNAAESLGGAIFAANPPGGPATGTTTIAGGSIRNNRAVDGGALFLRPNAVVTVGNGAAINGNVATGTGGAVFNTGTFTVTDATLASNVAALGGTVHNEGQTTIARSTISGNRANFDGGIRSVNGTTSISNSTISGNRTAASGAGGVQALGTPGPGGVLSSTVTIVTSTITDNVGSPGGIGSQGARLRSVGNVLAGNRLLDTTFSECQISAGATLEWFDNLVGQDPVCPLSGSPVNLTIDPSTVFTAVLGPLADNGGPTQTHALLAGSLAIDAGDTTPPGVLGSCPAIDQRGMPRPTSGTGSVARCDFGSFEQQTLSPTPAPAVTSTSIPTLLAGPAPVIIGVNGTGFRPYAIARWNGAPRATTVTRANQLQITLLAGDLASTADLAAGIITVVNPDGQLSNALAVPIVSSRVGAVQSRVVTPGNSTTVSTAPTTAGQSGVSATLTNNNPSSTPVTVTVANYTSSPLAGTMFAAGGFFDLQVTGADASDRVTASFYYPSTILAGVEAGLVLRYWNGTALVPVIGSGGAAPVKDTTNNLDGTVSGGRFSVTFDATSTPSIMDLGGTVFAIIEGTATGPPVTVATASPSANAAGWHKASVFVTLKAEAPGSTIARTEYNLDDRGWKPYTMPVAVLSEGIHTLRYRSVTTSGVVENIKTLTVKIDKTAPSLKLDIDPLILWPADGRLRNIAVDARLKDTLSGGDQFTLVSVDSNHRDDGGDIAGWTVGTPDTRGQLRAKFTGLFNPRIYRLTYKGVDRAGNETTESVYVLVLQLFGHP